MRHYGRRPEERSTVVECRAWCVLSRWPAVSASPSRSRCSRSPSRGGRRSRRRPPLDVRALPLALPVLALRRSRRPDGQRTARRTLASRRARRSSPRSRRLGLAVALRGPAGLPGRGLDSRPDRPEGRRPARSTSSGATCARCRSGAGSACAGPGSCACPPRAATSCGWKGRGRAYVSLDGQRGPRGRGRPLAGLGRDRPRPRDRSRSLVRLEQTAPGPRLRLGWTRPDGRRETIPPRSLGPPRPAWVWWADRRSRPRRGRPRGRCSPGWRRGTRRAASPRPGP